jgi:NAD(P)H-dependent FMN reductase
MPAMPLANRRGKDMNTNLKEAKMVQRRIAILVGHLRQSLVFLNMPVLQQPEAYIGHAAELFDDTGKVSKDSTRKFATQILEAYSAWVSNFSEVRAQGLKSVLVSDKTNIEP